MKTSVYTSLIGSAAVSYTHLDVYKRQIKDSAKKIFDVVLVWKLDRFARNRFDAVNYKYQLEKNGVHLVSAMEPISQGPEGIMVESMLIGMAEYYLSLIHI